MFNFSVSSELTRKYYERRINRFLDFIEFNTNQDTEQRYNDFAKIAQTEFECAFNKIISFLQFQKQRTEKGEISAATLINFVKALKVFCEISDITIPWKKISRGLPHPNQSANDRAPTLDEIKKIVDYPDRRISRTKLTSKICRNLLFH